MKTHPRSLRASAGSVLLTMGLLVSGCGGSAESDTADSTSAPTLNSNEVDFNDSDVMFAQMMIPHHEQAIELADIAMDPSVGASAEIVTLARTIKAAQDPEILQMKVFLSERGQSESADASVDHGSMMKGMLSVEELDRIGSLSGRDFDASWLDAMIAHHEGAVAMAESVVAEGSNESLEALARRIITSQTAEIVTLRQLAGK